MAVLSEGKRGTFEVCSKKSSDFLKHAREKKGTLDKAINRIEERLKGKVTILKK